MHVSGIANPAALPLILAAPPFTALRDAAAAGRHAVVAGDCGRNTVPPGFDRPTLRTLRRGTELLNLGARRLRLDQDSYLVANAGADRSSAYDADASALVVVFARGALAQSRLAPDVATAEAAPGGDSVGFLETLQPHGGAVSRHLREIERALREQLDDALWWDERIVQLLAAAIEAETTLQRRAADLAALKATTRRELLRRVLIASDHIQSNYDRPLALHEIAAAAHLSTFHLVRLFQRVHGIAPHAYLTRKRLQVALRLLAGTRLGLDEIATRAGLGTRSSLFRHLRRQQGSGAAALRARAASPMRYDACTTFA